MSPPTSRSVPIASRVSLSRDDELELIAAAKSSLPHERERALASLLELGMPMITMFARQYTSKLHYFVDYDDLKSAGCEGYLIAIKRYDSDKNTKLSTYASWWVRNRMIAEVMHACWLMGIPERTYKKLIKFIACSNKLQSNLARQPTSIEVATDLTWSTEEIRRLAVWKTRDALSLDSPHGNLETVVAKLAYQNQAIDHVDESAELNEMYGLLSASLRQLEEAERAVMEHRFFDDHTRQEIASILDIPVSRVRYLEDKALAHLRQMWEVSKGLKSYW